MTPLQSIKAADCDSLNSPRSCGKLRTKTLHRLLCGARSGQELIYGIEKALRLTGALQECQAINFALTISSYSEEELVRAHPDMSGCHSNVAEQLLPP